MKPENVLCGPSASDDVQLADFGSALQLDDQACHMLPPDTGLSMGTALYASPEVLRVECVSPASDMWSVGVLTYVLLSGCFPFSSATETLSRKEAGLVIQEVLTGRAERFYADAMRAASEGLAASRAPVELTVEYLAELGRAAPAVRGGRVAAGPRRLRGAGESRVLKGVARKVQVLFGNLKEFSGSSERFAVPKGSSGRVPAWAP